MSINKSNKELIECKETINNAKSEYQEIKSNKYDLVDSQLDNSIDSLNYWNEELKGVKYHLDYYNIDSGMLKEVDCLISKIDDLLVELF